MTTTTESLGIRANLLYGWKQQFEEKQATAYGKRNLKKGQCLLRKRNEVKFNFIKQNEGTFPVKKQCEIMNVSRNGYYAWLNRSIKIISELELMLYRRTKALFKESRQSLGSIWQLMKKLRKEGVEVGRDKVICLMYKLGLQVKQRIAYKVTTMRKHSHSVTDNIVDQKV